MLSLFLTPLYEIPSGNSRNYLVIHDDNQNHLVIHDDDVMRLPQNDNQNDLMIHDDD